MRSQLATIRLPAGRLRISAQLDAPSAGFLAGVVAHNLGRSRLHTDQRGKAGDCASNVDLRACQCPGCLVHYVCRPQDRQHAELGWAGDPLSVFDCDRSTALYGDPKVPAFGAMLRLPVMMYDLVDREEIEGQVEFL